MVIWKYELAMVDEQFVAMPIGAEVLTVQTQHNRLCVWAQVDPTKHPELRRFVILGTGNPYEHRDGMRYIGTVQTHGGSLVWHVFEYTPDKE